MRREPEVVKADLLMLADSQTIIDGRWVAARPLHYHRNIFSRFFNRLKLAYGVFKGDYDALEWYKQ